MSISKGTEVAEVQKTTKTAKIEAANSSMKVGNYLPSDTGLYPRRLYNFHRSLTSKLKVE